MRPSLTGGGRLDRGVHDGCALLLTLFAVVMVLGLMFWRLARLALRPYDEIIDTADEVVEGDLDRRVSSRQPDADIQRLVESLQFPGFSQLPPSGV